MKIKMQKNQKHSNKNINLMMKKQISFKAI